MQAIFDIAEICHQKGIMDAVLSPGSRCAPLTLAFTRHSGIHTRTISDERSAAFIGLGISQLKNKPVVLVCTSGSAAYNYAPAVAEAFFQKIPLVVLTADRPPEWIDQQDGQTIRQNEIYGKHVKASYTLPSEYSHKDLKWHINRVVNEAINMANEYPLGPVHINIPLREPFYPEGEIKHTQNIRIITPVKAAPVITQDTLQLLSEKLIAFDKIMIVAGQGFPSENLHQNIKRFLADTNSVLISDTISNCQKLETTIVEHDLILSFANEKIANQLQPDLLITFGNSVISKSLKTFIRKNNPKEHWHIQEAGNVADTFQSLTSIIRTNPELFFSSISAKKQNTDYATLWKSEAEKASKHILKFFDKPSEFTEFHAVNEILKMIPHNSVLHVSNSMPIRYVNYIGLKKKNIELYCNRGTSGIDGVVSTAFGAALSTNKQVTLIVGDMAFFYDRNAFWNNYIPDNLRIIILNNHGGGIFRIIDGPNKQPELNEYFETRQELIAVSLAHEYGLQYYFCKNAQNLNKFLPDFFAMGGNSKILEIETQSEINAKIFNEFKTINLD